jgi:hypothetical protein
MKSSDQQLANSSEPTTVDVYRPVATLDAEHRLAFKQLQSAVVLGDEAAMKQAFDAITYIEQRQRTAHQAVLEHARMKAAKKVQA